MALSKQLLQSGLLRSRSNLSNTPAMAALDQAKTLANYWATGMGPGGAGVVSAAAQGIMQPAFLSTYQSYPAAEAIAARKIAQAVNNGALSLTLAGGVYGSHISIISPGPMALAGKLLAIWKAQLPTASEAKREADAYDTFTKTLTANGSGLPPVPVPPQTGPIV